ncbi:MAG: hypothetical protein EDX89_11040 [Acidobacteria bacterium]|nr:MAG: hypothetical protein EDX89_11040 [Acidobacteriota bacterium]MCE7957697.1 hypothetical protein [Acidobacteria bacterium ACB2]
MWKAGLALLLLLGTAPLPADPPPARDEVQELNARFKELYGAKRYEEALGALEALGARPELSGDRDAQASIAYGRACLKALLGRKDEAIEGLRSAFAAGFSDLGTVATDADLDSLRADPRFVSLVAEARKKLGPARLEWDDAPRPPEFRLRFDDPAAPELAQLRAEFGIDPAVAGASDDLDRLVRLAKWTSEQWAHSPTQMASKPDPISILREAKAGGRFICRDYAIVAAGAARAFGLASRVISVLPKDVETRSEAHSVAEAWLPGRAKWVLLDGQYGIVPVRDGVPLNAVELQKALAEDAPLSCLGASARCEEWKWFVGRNLFYFKVAQDQRRFGGAASPQLVLVPKGASSPRKFAGGNESVFANALYTSIPASFYAPPEAEAPAGGGPDVPRLLGSLAAEGPRSEVLVLGTAHLQGLGEGLRRESLAPVISALERFRPTAVCVEHLPARDVAEMDARGGAYREVAEMFAADDLRYGRLLRRVLKASREAAWARAEALLSRSASLDAASRRDLVAWLVAAYEVPTALLQWSALPPDSRRPGPRLPEEVVRWLDRSVASPNEISSIAIPVARAAGLWRLVSVDSQWDGARILSQPEAAVEEAFGHPLKSSGMDSAIYREQRRLTEEAASGSLLPLYRFLNAPEYGSEDAVAQWGPWLRMHLASGVDRLRYGNWEARNARMVANLSDVTASTRAERVLFLVGVAHKPFVEDLLRRLVHVKVASFEDLAR